jgi:hypothetical protein
VKTKIRSGINKLLVLTISLGFALGLGEALVRVALPQQLILKRPDVWMAADSLGWVHRSGIHTTINTGERTVKLHTDADGFRVGSAGRVEAETNVLIVGDSFVEALQVEYEQSIAGLLQESLSDRVGSPVAVRNAAVDGWDPRQYYLRVRRALASEEYHAVLVFLYLGNDVITDTTYYIAPRTPKEVHPLRWPRSLTAGELIDAILYPINDALEVRSHLFILFKRRFDALLMRLGLTAAYFPTGFQRHQSDSPRWQVTASICEDIAAAANAHGVPTSFVLLPVPMQVEPETFRRQIEGFGVELAEVDLDQPNRLLAAALEERGLDVIDALEVLREAHGRGGKAFGEIDRHLSPTGHRLVAEVVEKRVSTHLRGHAQPTKGSL